MSMQLADSECKVVLSPPASLGADTSTHTKSDEEEDEEPDVPPRFAVFGHEATLKGRGETLFADLRDPCKCGAEILKLVSFLYSLIFPGRSPSEQRELRAASDSYLEEKATEWIKRAFAERKQQKALAEAKDAESALSEAAARVITKMEEVKEKEGKVEITEEGLMAAKAELQAARQEYEAKKVAREELQAAQKAAQLKVE
ncbi:hypothetical protein GPECTOR_17g1006 [Gonium pectorale]|uniref:Uncharacterized protein n=1 Tax=Gonium pectorale TaxID=33097 RepID=A0A150GJY8_GONPE|nr:hypothetical protein GPECTOR_17g1006 [Gonium pectorale]|eukprot:KXZ50133.1 hypothetical protein GPECTOR_17g1006 [Gonium pectorale]